MSYASFFMVPVSGMQGLWFEPNTFWLGLKPPSNHCVLLHPVPIGLLSVSMADREFGTHWTSHFVLRRCGFKL